MTPPDVNQWTIVTTRLAYDPGVRGVATALYIALFADLPMDGVARWVAVSTAEWASRLQVSTQTIRDALVRLEHGRYIQRQLRRGARYQHVRRVHPALPQQWRTTP